MSNLPPTPSYGGAPTAYASQWPAPSDHSSSTSIPPLLPHNFMYPQNPPPSQTPRDGAGQPIDHNAAHFQANAQLPGLGESGAGSLAPPPPFAFMPPFTPPQFPPFPMQMPPLGYQQMSIPGAPMPSLSSRPSTTDLQSQAHAGVGNTAGFPSTSTLTSRIDPDREEGELTDREGRSSSHREMISETRPTSSGSRPRRTFTAPMSQATNDRRSLPGIGPPTDNNLLHPQTRKPHSAAPPDPDSKYWSLEEGEASPESQSSSRDSGSPYNPPMSVTADFAPAENMDLETPRSNGLAGDDVSEKLISPKYAPELPDSGKSLEQLRVQAKGALLSLAPHNIRFSELVYEGVDPAVLRQLYEEVGIKVHSPPPTVESIRAAATSMVGNDSGHSSPMVVSEKSEQGKRGAAPDIPAKDVVRGSDHGKAATPPAPLPSSQSSTSKPLERKEVIARMLAAKAAKSSEASASPQSESAKEPAVPESGTDMSTATAPTTTRETPIQEREMKEKEVRVKETNKAQTELARKRIELLKTQGLMRNSQKPQSEAARAGKTGEEEPPVSTPPMLHHPLPERPPVSESMASRIPGLFMTDTGNDETRSSYVTPIQGLVVDSTPQPHVNQRKRPRASDFDEPNPTLKRPFSNGVSFTAPEDRLVIDISDDEFYGDDENGGMEVHSAQYRDDLLRPNPPSGEFALYKTLSSSQGHSASTTPQNSNNDQEHLRRKDLEIQAMHRRIAQLEERKKAKLAASRTQSPRAIDSSVSGSPEPTLPVENASQAMSIAPALPNDSSSTSLGRIFDDMSVDTLEDLKAKFHRKQELESGIPALNDEILKIESKLAEYKLEEEKLLSGLAKGQEGRQQLLDELKRLDLELGGISLEDLEAKLERTKAEEQQSTAEASVNHQDTSSDDVVSMPDASESESSSDEEDKASAESVPASKVAVAEPESNLPSAAPEVHGNVQTGKESSPTPSDESSGSSMDESSDSSSDSDSEDSESPESGESKRQTPVSEPNASDQSKHQDETVAMDLDDQGKPVSERPDSMTTGHVAGTVPDSSEQVAAASDQASRESSVSDAYEPPEPETNASAAGSDYSPPFSPPQPIESTEASRSPNNQVSKADYPLTSNVQETDAQQQEHAQNKRQPNETESKFTPYESPLKYFKAYRYHPNYTDSVSGGFRSLTYSHNIDHAKCICPYEAAGGVCNDQSCEYQHFRDMSLSDDKVLVQMGSVREGNTPEEKDNYIAGLKQIINDMRRDKVKDFSTVAAEIAAYRRRFLQDPSRILPL